MKAAPPDTLSPATDWRLAAACRGDVDDALWYADASHTQAIRDAVEVCLSCPVRRTCLAAALAEEKGCGRQSRYGIRGGLTGPQRWYAARGETRRGRALAECGTPAAYDRHVRHGEPVDAGCRRAHARRTAEQRQKARDRAAEHGTRSGYQKHLRTHTSPCDLCQQAHADAAVQYRRTSTAQQAADTAAAYQNGTL